MQGLVRADLEQADQLILVAIERLKSFRGRAILDRGQSDRQARRGSQRLPVRQELRDPPDRLLPAAVWNQNQAAARISHAASA